MRYSKIKTILIFCLIALSIFIIPACNNSSEEIPVSAIALNKTQITLEIGESQTLTATVTPDDADDKTVTWVSSDQTIATVLDGTVTAVSEGQATVTATTVNGKSATCTVTVTPSTSQTVHATGITLNKEAVSLAVGGTETVSATVLPDNATDKTVVFTTSNPEIATVSNGVITAISEGEATITATTSNGKTATCTVTVYIPIPPVVEVESVMLNKTTITLEIGGTAVLTASVLPENATNQSVSFTSSDEGVVEISSDGEIFAISAGEAIITVETANGKSATCVITVNAPQNPDAGDESIPATDITLNLEVITIDKEKTAVLTATIYPLDATNKAITWTSSDEDVATVANGTVKGKGEGQAVITATTSNGITATCTVTVTEPYYDKEDSATRIGYIDINGDASDENYSSSKFVKTVNGVTAEVKTAFVEKGIAIAVKINASVIAVNDSELNNSSAVIIKFGMPESNSVTNCYKLTVLADGRSRLEKPTGDKKVTENTIVNATVNGAELIVEAYVKFGDIVIADAVLNVMADISYVNPVDSTCSSASVVNFGSEYYNSTAPYTWHCFNKTEGYHNYIEASDRLVVNTKNKNITVSSGVVSYASSSSYEFPVKGLSDSANRLLLTLKSVNKETGIKYAEGASISVVKSDSDYFYKFNNENLRSLTLSEKAAIVNGGFALYTAYYGGSLYAYSIVDGEIKEILVKVVALDNVKPVVFTTSKINGLSVAFGAETETHVNKLSKYVDVTINYSFCGTVTVTVTAKQSSVNIKSISINGQVVNGTNNVYTVNNFNKPYVIVDGELNVLDRTLVLRASSNDGTSVWYIPEGMEVKINNSIYRVGKNGKISIPDMYEGTYNISLIKTGSKDNGFYSNDLTRSLVLSSANSVIESEINPFSYDVFKSSTSKWVIDSNETNFYVNTSSTSSSKAMYLNDVQENFVMSFTAVSKNPNVYSVDEFADLYKSNTSLYYQYFINQGLRIKDVNGNENSLNVLLWSTTGNCFWGIKSQGYFGDTTQKLTNEQYRKFNGSGLNMMYVKKGNVFAAYVENASGEYECALTLSFPTEIASIRFDYWDNPIIEYRNFTYKSEVLDMEFTSSVIESSDGDSHGLVSVTNVGFASDVVITVIPDEGYGIAYASYNGKDISKLLDENGQYIIKSVCNIYNSVEVRFEKLIKYYGAVKDENGNALSNRQLQFTMVDNPNVFFHTKTDANGNYGSKYGEEYSLDIPALKGDYIVDVYGLGTMRVTLGNSTRVDVNLGEVTFNNSTSWTYDDGVITYKNSKYFETLTHENTYGSTYMFTKAMGDNVDYTYAEMTVYSPFTEGYYGELNSSKFNLNNNNVDLGYVSFGIANGKKASAGTWGLIYNHVEKTWRVRFTNFNGKWQQFSLSSTQTAKLNSSSGLKLAIAITDAYVYGLLEDNNGNITLPSSYYAQVNVSSNVKQVLSVYSEFPYAVVSEVNAYAKKLTATASATTNGSLSITKAIYGQVVANIIPNDGYVIDTVKVGITDVTDYVTDGVLVYNSHLLTSSVSVSATFKKAYTVSGTLEGYNGTGNDFYAPVGSLVTLSNSSTSYTTRVGENGYYCITNIVSTGNYTLTVGTATPITVSITGDTSSLNKRVEYLVENDAYALTYGVYNLDGSKSDYTKISYDTTKYYDNLVPVSGNVPDPAVLKVEDEASPYYGEYLLYGTTDSTTGFSVFRSKDMASWEYLDYVFDIGTSGWEDKDFWAPEIVWEKDADRAKYGLGEGKGVYFFFYSSTAHYENFPSGCVLGLGLSTSPTGPFVRYVGYDSLGRFIDKDTPWLDIQKVDSVIREKYGVSGTHAIDPHPFIDTDGTKYLFMTAVKVCKFINNDWTQVDYDSFEKLVTVNYNYVTEDAANADGGVYKKYKTTTNEGPQVTIGPNGKYYMTISINGYNDKKYSVIQLVADNVLGPYRKITPEEGGILLSGSYGSTTTSDDLTASTSSIENLSGPGHHFMIKVGNELLVVYHRHIWQYDETTGEYNFIDASASYHKRYVAVDRVVWVENADGLLVMKTVGPTSSIQPKIYGTGQTAYDNIVNDATVTVSSGNASLLTDGIIKVYDIESFINEFETTANELTITITFDEYRTVAGLLVYNSMFYDKMFKNIDKIEIDTANGTAVKENLAFPEDYYDDDKEILYQGGAALLDFEEVPVKEIRITITNPNTTLALGELFVLGVPKT